MKVYVILFALSLAGFALAKPEHSRGCIYVSGRCSQECPEGTHGYSTGCGALHPEPTCERPTPEVDNRGILCDFSACYCDPPTVRDTETDKCVPLDQCPTAA